MVLVRPIVPSYNPEGRTNRRIQPGLRSVHSCSLWYIGCFSKEDLTGSAEFVRKGAGAVDEMDVKSDGVADAEAE